MYKKVAFAIEERGERHEIVETVLTEGYSYGMISEELDLETEKSVLTFLVHQYDVQDLRHDLAVLQKAGFNVREIEAS